MRHTYAGRVAAIRRAISFDAAAYYAYYYITRRPQYRRHAPRAQQRRRRRRVPIDRVQSSANIELLRRYLKTVFARRHGRKKKHSRVTRVDGGDGGSTRRIGVYTVFVDLNNQLFL